MGFNAPHAPQMNAESTRRPCSATTKKGAPCPHHADRVRDGVLYSN
jgi:hypothetical protein